MAHFRRGNVSQAFRNNHHLQQFMLTDVTSTGRILGTGSYGSVVEVKYQHLVCAGKKLHEALLEAGNEGVPDLVHKYLQECQLMSNLCHPNITQFLGLCFLPNIRLPLLVMEKLETSLDDLLEHIPNLPLSLKHSILEGVASGLVYLHKRKPPVIHRDLTAKNILLTSSLQAKITDMGNSRIIDMRPGQLARTLSKLPGTLVYMPPEALSDTHRYGPSLDIFSFGHLTLYTVTQVFPGNLLPATLTNPDNPEIILGRSEAERRGEYIKLMEKKFGQEHPALVQLVKQCLHNAPERRPTIEEVLDSLQRIKTEVEGVYGGSLMKLEIAKVLLEREMKRSTEELTQVEERCHEAIKQSQNQVEQLQINIEDRDRQIQQMQKDMQEMENREAQLRDKLQGKELEVDKLTEELRRCQSLLQEKQGQGPPKLYQLKWRHGPDMPFRMGTSIQSVLLEGVVYVGGGYTGTGNGNIIMKYDTGSGKWATMTSQARDFAMTAIDRQLVIVGGLNEHYQLSNLLYAWRIDSKKWTRPYPDMPRARSHTSVVTSKEWLVVVGGLHSNDVDILNTNTKQWHTGSPAPIRVCLMKSARVGDMWYLIGGQDEEGITKMYSVSLPDLISQVIINPTGGDPQIWKVMSQVKFARSTPLAINGSLFIVGGKKPRTDEAMSEINGYNPETKEWKKVGDLLSPRYDCTCLTINDGEIFMAGGIHKGLVNSTEIASFTK